MLYNMPDISIKEDALKALFDQFIILQLTKNLKEKILAIVAHISFISDPAMRYGLQFFRAQYAWCSIQMANGSSFHMKKRGFFQEYIFEVIRKKFKFKIRRRFFKRCFDLVIGVKVNFSNGGSLMSDSDSEFSSTVISMNSSNSEKSFSSRMVPLMDWRISLPSSRRASKSSSNISSMTSILKHIMTMAVSEYFLHMKPNIGYRFIFVLGKGSDFSEESVEKSWGKELANESGSKFIPCFDSSFVEFVQLNFCFSSERYGKHHKADNFMLGVYVFKHITYSEKFVDVFVRIGFGYSIELVFIDECQVITFNSKFVCGFRNGDCRTGSQSDNPVGNPHLFIIYWTVLLPPIIIVPY
uniref:Putative E3 ubiquitin-protein ligase LIN-1 n=1 Tax=Tanacetum cinerariifolium TaxID=118510 RepID=A0A6L2L8F6_TANCI|nr:putative E3 ubiquitin-protein ligase LIN-1 [Tanacetum cinerariifolium]